MESQGKSAVQFWRLVCAGGGSWVLLAGVPGQGGSIEGPRPELLCFVRQPVHVLVRERLSYVNEGIQTRSPCRYGCHGCGGEAEGGWLLRLRNDAPHPRLFWA